MAIYFKHTHTLTTKVPYQFTCERCGKDSGTLGAVFEGKSEHRTKVIGPLDDEDKAKMQKEASKILENQLDSSRKHFDKGIYDMNFKDKCPHCGKPQSWSVSGMEGYLPANYAIYAGVGGLVVSAGLAGFKPLIIIGAIIVCAFIGHIVGRIRVATGNGAKQLTQVVL